MPEKPDIKRLRGGSRCYGNRVSQHEPVSHQGKEVYGNKEEKPYREVRNLTVDAVDDSRTECQVL